MLFSSSVFLFLFLPAVWFLYLLIPSKFLAVRNGLLAAASLFFYAFGEPLYILLMIGSIVFNYFAARFLVRLPVRGQNILCAFTVAANLSMLGLFKYSPWLVGLINTGMNLSLPVPGLTIPVGISFYTFQILSYVVDVRRGSIEVQKNILNLLLYIAFFPQLIAGPIVKYRDIQAQIDCREITPEKCAGGIRRFIMGLSKKIIISNTVALIADAAFSGTEISCLLAWSGAVGYCIQLYFDFSGYSDMAIGLAQMFGFTICENFNYPYAAVSVRDFWKRWHISLTTWFREYVYIPLGGNRMGKVRTILNRLFVFFLTGLWHGANFTFLLWGMWHGLLMMLEQVCSFEKITAIRWLRPFTRLYTLLTVCLGFVVFRAPDIASAMYYIGRMFAFSNPGNGADALLWFSPYNLLILAAGVLLSAPLFPLLRRKFHESSAGTKTWSILGAAGSLGALFVCIMILASSSFNPFIYYNF